MQMKNKRVSISSIFSLKLRKFVLRVTDELFTLTDSKGRRVMSTYIRETSRPFNLQSVSVVGFRQFLSFAALLEDTPLHLRTHSEHWYRAQSFDSPIRQVRAGIRCSWENSTRHSSLRESCSRPLSLPPPVPLAPSQPSIPARALLAWIPWRKKSSLPRLTISIYSPVTPHSISSELWRNSFQTSSTCASLLWNIIPILSMNSRIS